MRNLFLFFFCLSFSVIAQAQISIGPRTETLSKVQAGLYSLNATISEADTTYYMSLNSNNKYEGAIIVELGYRDEAIVLLQSMLDYNDTKSKSLIKLNNPSENTAILQAVLGVPQYLIFKKNGARIYCYLTKDMIKKWIPKIKNFGKD